MEITSRQGSTLCKSLRGPTSFILRTVLCGEIIRGVDEVYYTGRLVMGFCTVSRMVRDTVL